MSSRKHVKLVGYILPPKTDNMEQEVDSEEEEEEEEEEAAPEFLDMREMNSVSSGAFLFQRTVHTAREVDFMYHGKKVCVKGRFPLKNPWWEITCSAQQYSRKLVATSYPSYKPRTDLKHDWCGIISLFLKECSVNPDFVTRFLAWLPKDRNVDLLNVEEALCEFEGSLKEPSAKEAVDYVRSTISKSDAAFHLRAAVMYPYIMKYLPTLLPGQFLHLLKKGKEEEAETKAKTDKENMETSAQTHNSISLLARLEETIKTEKVWMFGFAYVMYEEFRLVRCETKLKDFMSCDLFSKLSSEQQNALKLYNELKAYCMRLGHTYIERKVLEKRMNMPEESVWEAVAFLRKHGVLVVEREKIALRHLYKYEQDIANCLQQIIAGKPWKIDLDVREVLRSASSPSGKNNGENNQSDQSRESAKNVQDPMDEEPEASCGKLDPDQVQAAEMMCANPVTVISGKGGCGKTTVVSMIFKAAMGQQEMNRDDNHDTLEEGDQKENGKKPIEVLLTAPTGRAASLLTSKTCFTAYTMHQVVWSYMHAKKSSNGNPLKWKFSQVRVLVVDEGSLVCVHTLTSILSMLTKHAQLQKFIILGDIRQLPSIEPGNVLNDLFTSLKKVNWAIEMRTNHRAESELIVQNAALIADMGTTKTFRNLDYDTTVKLNKHFTLPSHDKSFIEILLPEEGNDDDLQNAVKRLLEGPMPGMKDDTSSQFIAFQRSECRLINEICCKHYSNHITKTHKKKPNFQKGDKVCCTRNGYVTQKNKVTDKENKAKCKDGDGDGDDDDDDMNGSKIEKERLCNGEIFFIKEDVTIDEDTAKKRIIRRELTLNDKQGRELIVDYKEIMRECKLQHAWARTIHTFQGSEEKTVVYVLDSGNYQTWKHVYTAVTRGQSRVYVITKKHGLEKAMREHIIKRNTRLERLVTDLLHDLGIAKKDFLSQPSQFQFSTPKRGTRYQNFQSTHDPMSSPGPSQAYPGTMSQQNLTGYGDLGSPKSASPSPCKREMNTDNCSTPSKQMKVDTPTTGYLKLQSLSLNSLTPKQLFPKDRQSYQDK